MIYQPYDIGFVRGDLVSDVWDLDVGLVTDIIWGVKGDDTLPTWVTVLWSGKGEENMWEADALKKVEKVLDFSQSP